MNPTIRHDGMTTCLASARRQYKDMHGHVSFRVALFDIEGSMKRQKKRLAASHPHLHVQATPTPMSPNQLSKSLTMVVLMFHPELLVRQLS